MQSRRLWLIDGGYLYKAQSSISGVQLDYIKLREHLEKDGPIWRAYYLNSIVHPTSPELDSFHRWLQSAPPIGPKIIVKNYSIKRFPIDFAYCDKCGKNHEVKCPACGERLHKEQQKGVDVGVATLALAQIKNYDSLLLSSGDGDLLDAVEHICQNGKQFELVVFRNGVSPDLQGRSDRIYWIDDFSGDVRRVKG
jgi:uncharacterized LabA/DUF88 family protein